LVRARAEFYGAPRAAAGAALDASGCDRRCDAGSAMRHVRAGPRVPIRGAPPSNQGFRSFPTPTRRHRPCPMRRPIVPGSP